VVKKLHIDLSDDVYDALATVAQALRLQPEQLVTEWVTAAVSTITGTGTDVGAAGKVASRPRNKAISAYDMPSRKEGSRRGRGGDALGQSEGGSAPNKEAARLIYQLKVTLKDSKPPIWRRIQVPGSITLVKLHRVLQVVMGWADYHLHQYIVDGVFYGTRDPEFEAIGTETLNERGVKLYQIAPGVGSRFVYEYDFGDGWQHQVVVEKLLPPGAGVRYPICITGKRACPPEDVGGIWSYSDLLEAIRDPAHPEHREMLQWAGGSFDPEAFDLEEVNDALKRVR
jgi:hypothetical protein